jgi:hypothetical protein
MYTRCFCCRRKRQCDRYKGQYDAEGELKMAKAKGLTAEDFARILEKNSKIMKGLKTKPTDD